MNFAVLHKPWKVAKVLIIAKPEKDPTVVESYRPISLLNIDCKILAIIIAEKQVDSVITEIIHPDQVGFVKNKYLRENVRKAVNVIDRAMKRNVLMVCFSQM